MKNLTEIYKGEGAICDPASVCDIFNGQKMSKKNFEGSNPPKKWPTTIMVTKPFFY